MAHRPQSSPWWYRHRALVIFAIYAIGFLAGNAVSRMWPHRGFVPSFVRIAPQHAEAVLWAATAVTFAGAALRFWGSSYLRPETVWNPDALRGRLLVDGPFRYVRNPLYLGNVLQAIGIGVLSPPFGWATIAVGNTTFALLLAAHESRGLRAEYGDAYAAYARVVPALVPRPTPAHVEGSMRGSPSFGAGVRAELLTLGLACGMAAFTVVGDIRVFFAALAVGWIAQATLRARTAAA
jgi:protein-S-isoprenylcysteine O-methyltransferase Ste14